MTTKAPAVAKAAPAPTFALAATSMLQRKCVCGGAMDKYGVCGDCKMRSGGGIIQRSAFATGATPIVPPIVHDVLRSPGRPLDAASRAFFEPRFGHDFGSVRVHADARAAESARSVNATAYTVGSDMVFGAGGYPGQSEAGRELLAHELTHVVQQKNAPPEPQLRVGRPDDRFEQQADRVARAVMRFPSSQPRDPADAPTSSPAAAVLQRRVVSGVEEEEVESSQRQVSRQPLPDDQSQTQPDPQTQPQPLTEEEFDEQAEKVQGRPSELTWSKQSPGLTEEAVQGQSFLLMNFAINSSRLKPEYKTFLIDKLIYHTITTDPMATIRIIGHADATGPKEFNEKLALARAKEVEAMLKPLHRKGGIESVTGQGSTAPIGDNDTVAGRARNRRVEVQVIPWKRAKPVAELLKDAQAGQAPFIYKVSNFSACPFPDTVKKIVEDAFRPIGIIQFDWDDKAPKGDAFISFDTTSVWPEILGLTGNIYMRSFLENQICKDDKDPKTCEKTFPETADVMGKAIGDTVAHEAGHLLNLDHVPARDNFMWSADLEALHGKKNQTFDEKVLMRRTFHLLQVHFNDSQLMRMATRIVEKRQEAKAHPHTITFE
jgi:outer membrane protein OmpA-like peptidoglycan-associated protein